MPTTKKLARRKRYPGRRRSIRRYKSADKPSVMVYKGLDRHIVPSRYKCKLRYTGLVSFNTTFFEAYHFVGNGLYDPDRSGVGSQPLGFDELMALYSKYRVYGSKINMQVMNNDSTNGSQQVIAGCLPSSLVSFVPTNIQHAIEQPYSKYGTQTLYSGNINVSQYRSTANMTGDSRVAVIADDTQVGTATANPSNAWDWVVYAGTIDSISSLACKIVVTIDYYCEFFDRPSLTRS